MGGSFVLAAECSCPNKPTSEIDIENIDVKSVKN